MLNVRLRFVVIVGVDKSIGPQTEVEMDTAWGSLEDGIVGEGNDMARRSSAAGVVGVFEWGCMRVIGLRVVVMVGAGKVGVDNGMARRSLCRTGYC